MTHSQTGSLPGSVNFPSADQLIDLHYEHLLDLWPHVGLDLKVKGHGTPLACGKGHRPPGGSRLGWRCPPFPGGWIRCWGRGSSNEPGRDGEVTKAEFSTCYFAMLKHILRKPLSNYILSPYITVNHERM